MHLHADQQSNIGTKLTHAAYRAVGLGPHLRIRNQDPVGFDLCVAVVALRFGIRELVLELVDRNDTVFDHVVLEPPFVHRTKHEGLPPELDYPMIDISVC